MEDPPVLETPLDEKPPHPRRWRTLRQLGALIRPFRGTVVLLLLLSIGAVAIEIVPPLLQRALVDQVLQAKLPADQRGQLLWLLLSIVFGLLMIRLAAAVIGVFKGWVSSVVGTTLTASLRCDLVRKLNELPLAFHNRHQVGTLMSRVAYDTENLHTLIYHITGGFLLQSLQMLAIGVALFGLNPKLAAVTVLPMPLMIAGGWYFTRYLNPRHSRYWEAVGRQASALTGMLAGIRVVKVFVQEEREIRRFSEASVRLSRSRQTVDISSAAFASLMGLLFAFGGLAVWYIGGQDVLADRMTLGSLMAFLAYLAMFYTPLSSLGESTTWFSSFYTTSRRLFEILDEPGESSPSSPGRSLEKVAGRIEFQNVCFGYDRKQQVLKDIQLEIPAGAMVGVMGRSGSGKSTLVSLIARLYEVNSGRILIDGVDVRQFDPRQLRRWIGMVPQEPFLFSGTLAENIAYGQPAAGPEEIILAAQQADAHGFIMRKALAYQTPLGEGGVGLSGGERQRLSIARALLVDPAILILDEATASVDAESERSICRAVRRFADKRTTIVISHRLSTLDEVDCLYVFDQGRLVEQGTRRQLQARNGLYAALARLQRDSVEVFDDAAEEAGGREEREQGRKGEGEKKLRGEGGESDILAHGPPGSNGQGKLLAIEAEESGFRWLDELPLRVAANSEGHLTLEDGSHTYRDVEAVAAFPAAYPRQYISFRRTDESGREVELGLLRDLEALPPTERELVVAAVSQRNPVRSVLDLREIRPDAGALVLTLVTERGPATMRMEKAGEGVQPYGENGLLLVDSSGGHFVIHDRKTLPKYPQRLLRLYFGD